MIKEVKILLAKMVMLCEICLIVVLLVDAVVLSIKVRLQKKRSSRKMQRFMDNEACEVHSRCTLQNGQKYCAFGVSFDCQ